jgi:hypothetical protein
VPEGRYAADIDGELRFFRVQRPTEGKWAGYTFVDAQASDDYHPIRNRAHREQVLNAIGADPEAAGVRYGRELGACCRCGRTLTSEWRTRGIGPECVKKGWAA